MNISSPFIRRPVGTTLLTIAIALAGFLGYAKLPVSPLPQIDFPTISVNAQLPGASPDTVATSLAAPLERHLGQIADVTEMTSQSQTGQARITLQFGLDRDINGAARDVQAAINAAQADLPANLLAQPTYRKVNPADSPILIISLTSDTLTRGQIYDAASSVLQQELLQVTGVGQVIIGGAASPAVRVELDPQSLFHYGIGLEDVRSALSSTNANAPKGDIDIGPQRWQIYTNDQANQANDYQDLIVGYRNGDPVHLRDVGQITDSVQNLRNLGLANAKPAVLIIVFREPGANILTTIAGVRAAIPRVTAAMPKGIDIDYASDRSITIRASLNDTQRTLIIAVLLVVAVVYVFLRNGRATVIPAIAVPVSIIGTFGVMYLLGFSLDNLSLMALTIATGFVVDDAIVVLENISRYMEDGLPPVEAARRGAGEVGFTVISITLSLIAVFLPILLMGGLVGSIPESRAAAKDHPPLPVPAHTGWLRTLAGNRAQPQLARAAGVRRHGRAQYLSHFDHTEGLLPRGGYRPAGRRGAGRPEHLVPADEQEAHADDEYRAQGSCRAQRGRLHRGRWRRRRLANQQRLDVHHARFALQASADRRGHRAAAEKAGGGARRQAVHAGGAGSARRRPAKQRAIPIYRSR
jgi:multidrug efflux pump